MINKQDQRSELQEKIAAELREKAKRTQLHDDAVMDGVDDMRYLEHTKQTTTLGWAWILIIFMAIVVIAMFLYQGR